MNLNEQIRQAYEAGRRQALNEVSFGGGSPVSPVYKRGVGVQRSGGPVSAAVPRPTPGTPGEDAIPGPGEDGYVGGGTHKWPGGSCPYRDIEICSGNGRCRIVRYYYWRGVGPNQDEGDRKWRTRPPYGGHPA